MAGISVSKSLVYAVTSPGVGIDVTKALSYAVVIPFVVGISVTKTMAYAVVVTAATERIDLILD